MSTQPIPAVDESDEDLLFLMASLSPRITGLPFAVWISPSGNGKHAARVKASFRPQMVPSEMASVTVHPPITEIGPMKLTGQQFKLLSRWIELNRDVIIKLWNGEIEYFDEAIAALKPIQP
jgi:hypothetical protein